MDVTRPGPVLSLRKDGETALVGDITLSEGSNVTLTQSGNDIEIAVSVSAGVNSLVPDNGDSGQNGNVDLVSGNNITITGVGTTNGDIEIACDISDLADLDNVSSNLQTAIVGSESADDGHHVATRVTAGHFRGFRHVNTSPTAVRLSPGVFTDINGDYWLSPNTRSVTTSSLWPGDVLATARWYYLYVGPGSGSVGTAPGFRLSRTSPDSPSTALEMGSHPSDDEWKFLASVVLRADSTWAMMSKVDSFTHMLGTDIDISSEFDLDTDYAVSNLWSYLPETAGPHLRLLVTVRDADDGNDSSLNISPSGFTTDGAPHRFTGPDNDETLIQFKIETTIGDLGSLLFDAPATQWDQFESVYVIGYFEDDMSYLEGWQ